jgi:hypothetical protein
MMKRLQSLLAAALVVVGGLATTSAQPVTDPGTPDTVMVDSAIAYRTGTGVVPVRFYNDQELTAIEVVLGHNGNQIHVDSFSFAGGRLDIEGTSNGFQITANSTVISIFSLAMTTPIPVGRGLLGRLYYSYPDNIATQVVPIDSITYSFGPSDHSTRITIADPVPGYFTPKFKRGYLDIRDAPTTFDSLWLDNIQTVPGQAIAVNIFAYNERNLAQIAIGLHYGSSLLHFDSLSFVGTRGAIAPTKTIQHSPSAHTLYTTLEFSGANPLAPGTGALATMHFTVDPATPDTQFVIDTVMVGVNSATEFTLTAADGGAVLIPIFNPGVVDVLVNTGVEDVTDNDALPASFSLSQNYPNPFNPTTTIEFALPQASHVRLEVFNILGRLVRTLVDRDLSAGVHRIQFDSRTEKGAQISTGVYFYRIQSEQFVETKKMLLLK